ncbi:sugar-phosphatase AraL [Lysinibacillus sp. PLM2]|nr:sugar-phosphatase AraL [Lysinibacillus sp. PLM2]
MKGFIIDLDGTIYKNYQIIDGAREAIELLKINNLPFVFLSNRGNISRKNCLQKLKRIGIDCQIENIILASTIAARFFQQRKEESVWILGDEGLREELIDHQVNLATKPEQADWLLITLHEQLTYEDLNNAFRAVLNGAKIAVTNHDLIFPREDGPCIDVGGLIAAITATTGAKVQYSFGKPSPFMRDAALQQLQLEATDCVVIGDGLSTDMQLGIINEMKTAFVLSGVATVEDLHKTNITPLFIGNTILDVVKDILEGVNHEYH